MKVELHPGLADGLHAAFEDGVLGGIGTIRNNFQISQNIGETNHYQAEKEDNYKE
jgi:hypothetical protein